MSVNFAVLAVAETLTRIVSFAVMVYVARVVGAEMYGALGVATAISLYALRIVDLGLEFHGPRAVANQPLETAVLATSALAVRAVLAVFLIGVVVLVGVALPQPESAILIACAALVVPGALNTAWCHLGLERSVPIAVSRVTGEIVRAVLVLFVVVQPDHVARAPLAQAAGESLTAAILIYVLHRRMPSWHRPRADVARQLIGQAAPLMWTTILGMIIYNSDLLFLRVFRDNHEVGIYACAYLPVAFIALIESRFRAALIPTLTRLEDVRDDQRRLCQTSLQQALTMSLAIAAAGYITGPTIIALIFGSDFEGAGPVFQVLIWVTPLLWVRGVFQASLVAAGRNGLVLRITMVATAVNVVLNIITIPRYGMLGAAVSTIVTELVRMILAQSLVFSLGRGFPKRAGFLGPVLATGATAAILVLAKANQSVVWSTVPTVTAVYLATIAILHVVRRRL